MVSPSSAGNTTPTEAERETAWSLLHSGGLDSFRAEAIAQHLADQRARYETVAETLERIAAERLSSGLNYLTRGLEAAANTETGYHDGLRSAAERIRQVAR